MKKGQVSVELLIILATVLVISFVSVTLLTGSTAVNKNMMIVSSCQTAAKQCDFIHRASPSYSCSFCDTQCVDPASGNEIFNGAIDCCKAGNASLIYVGSSSCSVPAHPVPACSSPIDCNDNNVCTNDDCLNGHCLNLPNDGAICGDDGNDCTVDECQNKVCSKSFLKQGAFCNGGAGECDGNGVCVAYQCTTNPDPNCPSDTDCETYSCDVSTHTCVSQDVNEGGTCDGGVGECKSGTCVHCIDDDNDGYGVNSGSDCQFSGVDCVDSDASIHPGITEDYNSNGCNNGVDDDCDGDIDSADSDCPSWHIETVISSGNVHYDVSLAFNSSGSPYISYCESASDRRNLKYIYKNSDGSWASSIKIQSSDYIGMSNSLGLYNNYPYFAYWDYTFNDAKYFSSFDSSYHTIDSADDVGEYISMDMDSNGYPHVAYYDSTNGDLKYAYKDSSGWHVSIVDSADDVGEYPSIKVDLSGDVYISYYNVTGGDLKYAYKDSSGWHISTLDSVNDVGLATSIALKDNSFPRISYVDYTNNFLNYIKYNESNGNWQKKVVYSDPDATVGIVSTSIALKNNYPYISYYYVGGDYKGLGVAWEDSSGWHNQIIDGQTEGDVGSHSSIAVASDGTIGIAYVDDTDGYLKYASYY